MTEEQAKLALHNLLWELPAEFSMSPPDARESQRESFTVIHARNVRKVHQALWDLQEYFGMTDD